MAVGNKFTAITHGLGLECIEILMPLAFQCEDWKTFREKAITLLPQPSLASKKDIIGDFKRRILSDSKPMDDPAVILWNSIKDRKIKQEILLMEIYRHLPLIDRFVIEVMNPKLKEPYHGLFATDYRTITREEVDDFLKRYLKTSSKETAKKTRHHLGEILMHLGLLKGEGEQFKRSWWFCPYNPTFIGWLYALHHEFEDTGFRKRSEHYIINESLTRHRFLTKVEDIRAHMNRAVKEGYLEEEHFGGDRFLRLSFDSTKSFAEAIRQSAP